MITQLARWGNSLALRLPKALAEEARLVDGDSVEVSVQDGAVVIRPAARRYSLDELVDRITNKNRHRETDWGRPAGRESW